MEQRILNRLQSRSKRLVVAAIDFGTTYSGFAFSWKNTWTKVQCSEWSNGSFLSNKTPTVLLLNPDQTFLAFGYNAETLIAEQKDDSDSEGNEIKKPKYNMSEYYYFQRFKMLLFENENLNHNFMISDVTGKKVPAMKVFSISIKYLKDEMIEKMNKQISSGKISIKDIEFILTVPANWGEKARFIMEEAAIEAGIKSNQLTVAFETDAASIFCQIETQEAQTSDSILKNLGKEHKFIVIDLGGGSVDISVHKTSNDGILEEMIPTTGRSFGGILVDEEYEKFLESIGGKGIFKSFATINMEDYLTALRDFETKKREVNEESKNIRIRIPLSLDRLISSRTNCSIPDALQKTAYAQCVIYDKFKFCLPLSEFKTFFKSVLNGITKYIEDIHANSYLGDIKDIFMVGGFSECKIIQDALRERFNTLHFIMPADAKIAVLKGAVYLGHLPNTIISKLEKRIDKDTRSKSTRFAVAAMVFGSKHSGLAFSFRFDWGNVLCLSKDSTYFSRKVQTSLLLYPDKKFCAFGFEAESHYYFMEENSDSDSENDEKPTKNNCDDYYYFPSFDFTDYNLNRYSVIKDISGKPMRVLDLYSISIKYFKDLVLHVINQRLAEGRIEADEMDFVLTVPALFGDRGTLFFREAAINAGIKANQLSLVWEPEAVSVYCQYRYLEPENENVSDETFKDLVQRRSKYMICDLGGSTANFTIHRQADDGTLEELLSTTLTSCCGTSVKNEFEKFLETVAGEGILEYFAKTNKAGYLKIMREFEMKTMDIGSWNEIVRIRIPLQFDHCVKERNPGGLSKALKNSKYRDTVTYKNLKLCFKFSEYVKLFQNAIDGLIECVANILAEKDFADINDIIMVGGLSNYQFFQKALREKFKKRRFFMLKEPELADLKGAVYFGHLPNAISRRAARYTYGVQIFRTFRPGEDPEDKKNTFNGLEQCKDVFYPLVKRGKRIEPGCIYSVECQSSIPYQKLIQCGLYVSTRDSPQFVDEKDCKLLGKVTVKFPLGVPNADLEETIIFGETEIIFRVKELNTGKVFGTAIDPLEYKMSSESLMCTCFVK